MLNSFLKQRLANYNSFIMLDKNMKRERNVKTHMQQVNILYIHIE